MFMVASGLNGLPFRCSRLYSCFFAPGTQARKLAGVIGTALYEVKLPALRQEVQRNLDRLAPDFPCPFSHAPQNWGGVPAHPDRPASPPLAFPA